MKRKIALALLLVLVILGGLVGVKALQIGAMVQAGQQFTIPPETVSAAEVRAETWETTLGAVGTVTAVQGVTLRAEVPGTVGAITFESGGHAAQGQVLVRLDTGAEEAQLRSAEARHDLARANVERARDLRRQDLIAQSELDQNEAAFRQTAAEIDNIRAQIAKKTIRAPFGGRLGIRAVNLGQFVNAGDPIVSLSSLDPVYVDFSLPEQQMGQIGPGMPVRIETDAAPGQAFEGRITAEEPDVDAQTRNVKLQATLPNPHSLLRPGMFARVTVVLPERRSQLVIPATAVLHAPYGDSVFVINDVKDEKSGQAQKQVQMTTVRLGGTRGDFVAVTGGLAPGQQIASSGVFKLRNGAAVVIDNSLAPQAEVKPRPADS